MRALCIAARSLSLYTICVDKLLTKIQYNFSKKCIDGAGRLCYTLEKVKTEKVVEKCNFAKFTKKL